MPTPTNDELERSTLRKNSPYSLPDDPAESGWSTAQIKEKFYSGLFYLHSLLCDYRQSNGGEVTSLGNRVSQLTEIVNGLSSGSFAAKDDDGNVIKNTYAKLSEIVNGNIAALNYLKKDGSKEAINDIEPRLMELIAALQANFTDTKAKKAIADAQGREITETYETKEDATAKVAKSNLRTVLGLASPSGQGLMSQDDKIHLDGLYEGSNSSLQQRLTMTLDGFVDIEDED